jgi:hypothetical protein
VVWLQQLWRKTLAVAGLAVVAGVEVELAFRLRLGLRLRLRLGGRLLRMRMRMLGGRGWGWLWLWGALLDFFNSALQRVDPDADLECGGRHGRSGGEGRDAVGDGGDVSGQRFNYLVPLAVALYQFRDGSAEPLFHLIVLGGCCCGVGCDIRDECDVCNVCRLASGWRCGGASFRCFLGRHRIQYSREKARRRPD